MTSSIDTKSVEEAFRPAFDEIQRRRQVAEQCRTDTIERYFEPSDDASRLPFDMPGQAYVLLTFGTRVLAPRPEDPVKVACRIYGAFATREEAVEHCESVRAIDQTCSLIAAQRNTWLLMPATEEVRDDPTEIEKRTQRHLKHHAEERAREAAEFERDVAERASRPEPAALTGPTPEEEAEQEDADRTVYPALKRLRAGAEVRGQTAAAVCLLPDPLGGECLVRVLNCFETSHDAENWIRNVGSRQVMDHDIHVVPLCEWFYPNAPRCTTGNEHYRAKELQRIMDGAARNTERVQEYKDWKREQEEGGDAMNVD